MKLSKHATLLSLVAATSLIGCNRGAHEPDKNPDNKMVDQQGWDQVSTPAETEQRTPASETKAESKRDERSANNTTSHEDKTRDNQDQTNNNDGSDFGPVLATPNSQVGGEQHLTQTRPGQANVQAQDDQYYNDSAQPAQNEGAPKRGVVGRVGQGLSNAGNAVKGVTLGTAAATGYYASELYHAWRPTEDTTGRRDALDAMHDRITDTRAAAPSDLASLKDKIAQTPPNGERISSIVTSDSETKRLLVSVLTEQNPENVAGASERLVSEIFKTADDADAKVQDIQFSLRDLATSGAYDSAASARVSYLQTELDKRIASDDLQATLKRNTFLIMSTAAGAAFAGYNGVERTAEALRAIPFRRGYELAEDGVTKVRSPRFWNRAKRKAVAKLEDGKEAAAEAKDTVLGRTGRRLAAINTAIRRPFVRTSPKELLVAEIRDLLTEAAKVDKTIDVETVIRNLRVKPISKAKLKNGIKDSSTKIEDAATQLDNHTKFHASAIDGLSIAVRNDVEQAGGRKLAADEYQIVFDRVIKKGEAKTQTFASAPLKNQAAYDLADALKTAPAPKREIIAAQVVGDKLIPAAEADAQKLGQIVADTERASEGTKAGSVVIEGPRTSVGDTTETASTVAESKIEAGEDLTRIANETKAGAKRLQKRVAERTEKTVKDARAYANRSIAAIKGDKPFDPAKAIVGGTMVGLPAYLFSRSAYFQGRRVGEGYDALYLEDLIPADRLQKVVIQPDGTTEPAQ